MATANRRAALNVRVSTKLGPSCHCRGPMASWLRHWLSNFGEPQPHPLQPFRPAALAKDTPREEAPYLASMCSMVRALR